MLLQFQVQFDGHTLIGCNAECTQVCLFVSLRKSIPFVISAIPLVKNSGEIVYQSFEVSLIAHTISVRS